MARARGRGYDRAWVSHRGLLVSGQAPFNYEIDLMPPVVGISAATEIDQLNDRNISRNQLHAFSTKRLR